MALQAPGLQSKFRTMLPELLKFAVVGGIGSIIDLGGTAILHSEYHVGPFTAKALAVTAATVVTYLGSRFWTFKHRENQSARREAVLFIVLNIVGLLIAEAVIGFVTYAMGLHGKLDYNAASVIGTGLATVFRFYAYRKWVFTAPAEEVAAGIAAAGAPDLAYAPWDLNPDYLAPGQSALAPAQSPAQGSTSWDQQAWNQRSAWDQPAPAYSAAYASDSDEAPANSAWGQPDPSQPWVQEPVSTGRVTSPTLTALPAATHDPRRPDTRPDNNGPRFDSTGPRSAGRHRRA
jgi:putative flippase GtrA